jgi:hypothetical protein
MYYKIVDGVDSHFVGSLFDLWSPRPITRDTLDQLPKGCYVDCGELGSGRHGTVRHVQVRFGVEIGEFAAKLYQQQESQEEDLDNFADLLQLFTSVHHPCLANIVFAGPPTSDDGPVLWTDFLNSSSLGVI